MGQNTNGSSGACHSQSVVDGGLDIVTNRLTNLHNEVVRSLDHGGAFLMEPADALYAVAYRPSRQTSGDQIEIWPVPLAVGQPLPVLPLGLLNAGVVPVDLDSTYQEACRRGRLGDSARPSQASLP